MNGATYQAIDLDQAVPFLEALSMQPGGLETPFTWQTFDDNKGRKLKALVSVKHGALQHRLPDLEALQAKGAGCFVTVNQTDLKGRKQNNIVAARAIWADLDDKDRAPGVEVDLQSLALPPTMIVKSGHGMHLYWMLATPTHDLGRAKALLDSVQHHLRDWGCDANATDIGRVLRLPGSWNMKPGGDPVMARLLAPPNLQLVYDLDDLEAVFPLPETNQPAMPAVERVVPLPQVTGSDRVAQARRYFAKVPTANQGEGGDRATFVAACKAVRGFDLSDAEALEVLSEWNTRCAPPWSEADLVEKIAGARKYGQLPYGISLRDPSAPSTSRKRVPVGPLYPGASVEVDDAELSRLRRDELALAERFLKRYGHQFRYFATDATWLAWDGKRWRRDNQLAERFAQATLRDLLDEADTISSLDERGEFLKFAAGCQKAFKVDAILKVAKNDHGMIVYPDQVDADPFLLNVANGVIDLRTGKLLAHDPALLQTKLAPVEFNPDATCPTWLRFINSVMFGDAELIEFLQRALGYCLTADVSEQVLLFFHGNGSNGKSTMLDTVRRIMGDYAVTVPHRLLMGDENHDTDALKLMGARLAEAHEVRTGARWNEASLKRITGGDTLQYRALYSSQHTEFRPTHKVLVSGNHRPQVDDLSYAFWRRMRLVPFVQRYVGPDEPGYEFVPEDRHKDPLLAETLRAELPGILAWLVRGCMAWQAARQLDPANGLGYPEKMREAVKTYREDQDPIGRFLDDRCVFTKGASVTVKALAAAYESWTRDNGEGRSVSTKAMTQAIQDKVDSMEFRLRYGFNPAYKRTNTARLWEGIGLTSTQQHEEQ